MTPTDFELLVQINAERERLGMSTHLAVRIGLRNGLIWAALSRHVDSPFTEGACSGQSIVDALVELRDKLRGSARVSCSCGSDRDCPRCLGVGFTVRAGE